MCEYPLEIENLEKSFDGFRLGPVNLKVPAGSVYGLIGPNGAGKTTLIDLIMGMGSKQGVIRVFGMDTNGFEKQIKLRTGYVSPDASFNAWGTVNRLIRFFRAFYPTWDDDYCIDLLNRFRIGWKDSIANLSTGSRTKLNLVLALSHQPDLLLLDEPMTGLDAVAKKDLFLLLLDAVQDEKRTILISSHNLNDIERFCDHIAFLDEGLICMQGPATELIDRFRLIDGFAPAEFNPENIDGVWLDRQDDDRWRLLADTSDGAIEKLAEAGLRDITEARVTLEEIFVILFQLRLPEIPRRGVVHS